MADELAMFGLALPVLRTESAVVIGLAAEATEWPLCPLTHLNIPKAVGPLSTHFCRSRPRWFGPAGVAHDAIFWSEDW